MKKQIKLLFTVSLLLLASIPGCKSGSESNNQKLQEPIEIKGVKIGMTREEIRNISKDFNELEDFCGVTIGNVEGSMEFVFDTDDKLDQLTFTFPGREFNTVREVVNNKYPLKESGNEKIKVFTFKDEHGTTLSMDSIIGGVLYLTSESYSQKESDRREAEKAKKINDL